jgi:CTP synthase
VISGIGKGVAAASIALILKSCGYRVNCIKFENYLNIDAGTINPIEHGDPFLCEDGTEADMDIGTYEKFLDQSMGSVNFCTAGQIYQTVIHRERHFGYNGEDVQEVIHITAEIIERIHSAARSNNAQIMVVELGGTAGEYQNIIYYEAARQLALKKPGDVIHVHVGYVPTPSHLGEPKTKPTQLSVRVLHSMGIQPDFIIARSRQFLDKRRQQRLALFCSVSEDAVISCPNVSNIYMVPRIFADQALHTKILKKLKLPRRRVKLNVWDELIEKINQIHSKPQKEVTIAIVGKYFDTGNYQIRDAYAALLDAIVHASIHKGIIVKERWVSAEEVEKKGVGSIGNPDGIIVPIGWGERGSEGMITAASYARKHKIPYLGLCFGMQLAVVAFARDVLGLKSANTTENNPKTPHPVIHLIPSQEEFMKHRAYGGTMRLGAWEAIVKPNTRIWEIYSDPTSFRLLADGTKLVSERHRHRYEFNDAYAEQIEKAGLVISGRSRIESLVEYIELPETVHPFYVGTQGHPEYKSTPLKPHPIFVSFLTACEKISTQKVRSHAR